MIRGKYMKEILIITISVAMALKFIQMGMFILASSIKIKNMGKANFIGLVYHLP